MARLIFPLLLLLVALSSVSCVSVDSTPEKTEKIVGEGRQIIECIGFRDHNGRFVSDRTVVTIEYDSKLVFFSSTSENWAYKITAQFKQNSRFPVLEVEHQQYKGDFKYLQVTDTSVIYEPAHGIMVKLIRK